MPGRSKKECSKKLVDCKWIDIRIAAILALGVFNSFDTSLFDLQDTYTLKTRTMKTPSTNVIDQLIQSIHKKFIWNNKTLEENHSTLIADYKGGYKDVDTKSEILSLKVSWNTNFHLCKIIANQLFSEVSGGKLFFTSILKLILT